MKALIAAAMDSLPTGITFIAADRLANLLESMGVDVFRFDAWKSSQPLVTFQLWMKPDIDFVAYFGHGANDRLFGQLPWGLAFPLVDLINKGIIQGRIVYTIACDSGRQLGPESGAHAYFGSQEMMYVALNYPEHNYMEDFIDSWLMIPTLMVKGYTAKEAYDQYISKCQELEALYNSRQHTWPNAEEFARMIGVNWRHYRLFGDAGAKL